MKILPINLIREADSFTIKNEPIADIDLMERASKECFKWLKQRFNKSFNFYIICGTGNNGGDGYALSRMLIKDGYVVNVFFVKYSENISDNCQANIDRLKLNKNQKIIEITDIKDLTDVIEKTVIIDALFGSGISKVVEGLAEKVIKKINESNAIVVSIDLPSGLYADKSNKKEKAVIVNADFTLTFQFPKLSFLMPENDIYVGDFHVLDIKLHKDFIDQAIVDNNFMLKEEISFLIKERSKYSHKGTYGHALLIAGSYGKIGAAVLSSKACMRAGAGLLTVHLPKCGYNIMQSSVHEAMVETDEENEHITPLKDVAKYNAIAIGPGIGMHAQTQSALKLLIQESSVPLVIDADAINILGENKTWLSFLPKGSILTPHPKEFERISRKVDNDFERLDLQRVLSIKNGIYIVLKGAHTIISCPDGQCFFNSSGNPGMATAGSGDVLTGIILGLLAQNYTPKEATLIGVFLHGFAGDIAASYVSMNALIASDIIAFMGKAFKKMG